jgi:PAS domain-containing protein
MPDDLDALTRIGAIFMDGYLVIDRDRKISAANPVFAQMLGIRPGERRKLLGARCCEHLKLETCQKDCIALDCMKKNTPLRLQEIHGHTAEGAEFILDIGVVPLIQKDEVGGALITYRDVTDERKLKTRYMDEAAEHKEERTRLLRIIEDREVELENLRQKRAQESEQRKT